MNVKEIKEILEYIFTHLFILTFGAIGFWGLIKLLLNIFDWRNTNES